VKIYLPTEFLLNKIPLSWDEILYGIENSFIGAKTAVDFAIDRISKKDSTNQKELELAGLLKDEFYKISDLVTGLAENEERRNENEIKMKWLFLILSWVYVNREQYEDPLGIVEKLYADFDYPEEISEFVRYMPVQGDYNPGDHSQEENENRIYNLWHDYLNKYEMKKKI
jgi:hypothetical protein